MIYSKINKGKLKKLEFKTNQLKFGWVGLKATNSGFLNEKHIEAAKQAIARKMKKQGKIWVRVVPNFLTTRKTTGSRMGKGKGNTWHKSIWIFGGWVLFEISGINLNTSIIALKTGSIKLPLKTKIFT